MTAVLFFFVFLLFIPSRLLATPAVVQSVLVVGNNVTFITTGVINTTTGNLFVASLIYASNPFSTFTDNNSLTWATAIAEINDGSTFGQELYVENGTGRSGHTFTLTLIGAGYPTIVVQEVSGIIASGSLDKTSSQMDSATTSHTSLATATTTQASEMLLGFAGSNSSSAFTIGGSFIEDQNASDACCETMTAGHLVVSSTGAYAFTSSTAGVVNAANFISTWKATVAAATAVRHRVSQ